MAAKLVDMGLARMHQVEPQGNDLTASGVTLGTFDYISPEQARDPAPPMCGAIFTPWAVLCISC